MEDTEPKRVSRFILITSDEEHPSARLVFDLTSKLHLNRFPDWNVTTTEYSVGQLVGRLESYTSIHPDFESENVKAWVIKATPKS